MPQALPALATAGKVAGTVGQVVGAVGAAKNLLGGGSSGSTTQTTQLDPQTAAMQQDLYNRAKGVAQQPFVPYTGPQVAGFNPDQLRQFQATRGLFESGMGYDPTKALQGLAQEQRPMTGQAASLLGQDISAYQSPYQQQVIDLAMGDIQKQADIARGGAQDRAIRAGAFGGSRSAILEAESQTPYAEAMAKTSAGLRQSGFQQAQQAAQSDLARQQQLGIFGAGQQQQRAIQQAQFGQQAGMFGAELGQQRNLQQAQMQQQRQMAGLDIAGRAALSQPQLDMQARAQRAGLLGGLQGQQTQGLGLLGGIGQQQQGLQQQGLGAARGEFNRALGYGQQQLGLLQGGLGTPLVSTTGSASERGISGKGVGEGAAAIGTLMGLFSDKKLKENIKPIGKSANGHNLYTWDWNEKAKGLGIDSPTTGVLAQEVMKYMPEAVFKDTSGYYKVNYGVL